MIAQLRGKIVSKTSTEIVIDCNGVGYLASITVTTSEKLPGPGEEAMVYTLLIPREDALNLYGFRDEQERLAFTLLTSISGIGAKIALGILSSLSIEELRSLVIEGNTLAMTKLPGIGKKTAGRIILELKDKMLKLDIGDGNSDSGGSFALIKQEALAALVTLGYSRLTAEKAVKKAADDLGTDATPENLIKVALKYAMK